MPHAMLGEFLGTMILIVFGGGAVANVVLNKSKGQNSGWIVIATGWFMAVVLGVFAATSAGSAQADINPAVTLAKLFEGIYPDAATALALMLVQVAGGFCGGALVWLHYKPHWAETADPAAKLAVFCTAPAIRNTGWNLWSEIFGTFILVLLVHFLFAKPAGAAPVPSWLAPYLVGTLVWGIGLSLGGTTGYAINPARDLGPRLAHAALPIADKGSSDWGYAWVPVAGPFIGALLALGSVRLIGIS